MKLFQECLKKLLSLVFFKYHVNEKLVVEQAGFHDDADRININ